MFPFPSDHVNSGCVHVHSLAHIYFYFAADKLQSIDSHSTEEVGEVENNPVSKAIARYLGIDISAEGHMAKNRKGIAIIVHGTPLSGRHSPEGLRLWGLGEVCTCNF